MVGRASLYLGPVFAATVLGLLVLTLVRDHVYIIPATRVSFTVPRSTAEVGEVIPVSLHVEGLAKDLMGFNAVVTFEPSLARLEGVEKPAGGSLLDPVLIHFADPDQEGGRVEISATRDGGPAPGTSGDLFTLKFRLLREGQLSVEYATVSLRDGYNRPITIFKQEKLQMAVGSPGSQGARE